MTFIFQWIHPYYLMTGLMMLAFFALPMNPLWAQENTSSKDEHQNHSRVFSEGIHLYGQSRQPDQIGKEYIVFEVTQRGLIGVLYLPHSEFSCFRGKIAHNQLEMIVDHPYDETTYAYAIELESVSPIASNTEDMNNPLTLQGYHPLEEISENDQRMLAVCKQQF